MEKLNEQIEQLQKELAELQAKSAKLQDELQQKYFVLERLKALKAISTKIDDAKESHFYLLLTEKELRVNIEGNEEISIEATKEVVSDILDAVKVILKSIKNKK